MSFDAFKKATGVPAQKTILRGIQAAPTREYRSARRGVERAYLVASGAVLFVGLHHSRCRRHLKRAVRSANACGFWFTKSSAQSGYRLFEVSVLYNRPEGLTFNELTAKYFERYKTASKDRTVRQPASAPPARAIRWDFQVGNSRYSAYFHGRANGTDTYRFGLSAKDMYEGGSRFGRRLSRMRVSSFVLD
jgi:hypothetical protein